MRKFSCVHCGYRLAVQPRHLGRLVTCPECGRATHPLAEQILTKSGHQPVTKTVVADIKTVCDNCGLAIGKLQQQRVLDGHTVCIPCHTALMAERQQVITRTPIHVASVATPASSTTNSPSAVRTIVAKSVTLLAPDPSSDANLRVMPLQMCHRLLAVLAALCIAGVAIYGALTLLRDLAGLLTTAAIVLLAAAVLYILIRAMLQAGHRAIKARSIKSAREDEEITAVVVRRD